jgi:hypothetical protein
MAFNPLSLFGRGAGGRAAQEAAENLGRAGVTSVDDLSGIVNKLVEAGARPADIPSLLPLILGGAGIAGAGLAAAAAPAATTTGGIGAAALRGLGALGTEVGAEAIANQMFGRPYSPASPDPTGRGFLTTTAEQLAYEQYAANENFRRSLLNLLPGADLARVNPQEALGQASERKSRELGESTARKIQEIQATGGIQLGIQQLIKEAEIEKQRLAGQAQVASEREKSLGDIQRQRVESSYQTASDLLNQAIKDVVARERYENNTSLAELAKAV